MSLIGALGSAQRSLSTFARGLAIAQENIANASTPGYARQRLTLAPVVIPGSNQAAGVEELGVRSLREQLLEYQAYSARQQSSQLQATVDFYGRVESVFRLDGQGSISDAVDRFFSSAGELSANPNDFGLRQAFKDAGNGFAATVRDAAAELDQQLNNINSDIRETVRRVNTLMTELAELQESRAAQGQTSVAVDTRSAQAFDELSELIGFEIQTQRNGTRSVITGSTVALTGNRVRPLGVSTTSEGLRIFDADGRDVTESIQANGGKLGGLLEARNETWPQVKGDLNRFAKSIADNVNAQLSRGVDLTGQPGGPLFDYQTSYFEGTGRTAGQTGAATPAPPVSIDVTFSGGVTGSISATLDSFVVGTAPPTPPAAGDTITLEFTGADGEPRTITTAPLLGGETTADLATRINDQIALDPDLAGAITASDEGGSLKLVVSDDAKQGFDFTVSTSNPGFTTGLEPGGSIGGHSAEEIAAALNEQIALDPDLVAANVSFSAVGGELRLDGDVSFSFTVTDNDPAATGFASGLDGVSDLAGGGDAATTLTLTDLGASEIAAGSPDNPTGNGNAVALAALAHQPLIDGLTFSEYYAGVVTDIGGSSLTAQSLLVTQQSIAATAEGVRDSFQAVDVNEEAVQLMQYEQGYSAMLRVIQVIDQLSTDVLAIVR